MVNKETLLTWLSAWCHLQHYTITRRTAEQKQGEGAHRETETEIDKEIQRIMYGHIFGSNRKDSVMLFASNSRDTNTNTVMTKKWWVERLLYSHNSAWCLTCGTTPSPGWQCNRNREKKDSVVMFASNSRDTNTNTIMTKEWWMEWLLYSHDSAWCHLHYYNITWKASTTEKGRRKTWSWRLLATQNTELQIPMTKEWWMERLYSNDSAWCDLKHYTITQKDSATETGRRKTQSWCLLATQDTQLQIPMTKEHWTERLYSNGPLSLTCTTTPSTGRTVQQKHGEEMMRVRVGMYSHVASVSIKIKTKLASSQGALISTCTLGFGWANRDRWGLWKEWR